MSIPLRRDFLQFHSALEPLANEWPNLLPEEIAQKVMTPYQLMSEKIIDFVADKEPDIHAKLANDHTMH